MLKCNFTYNHYSNIIKSAKENGYFICSFEKYMQLDDKPNKVIVLRHDIDRKIKKAVKMAKLEASLDVDSTYFFRLHAKYNLFDYKHYSRLLRIKHLGHELAFHLETQDFASCFNIDASELLAKEIMIMNLMGMKVIGLSEHGIPNKNWENHFFSENDYRKFEIKYHALDELFSQMKYISDSGGKWREGCLCKHINKYDKLQVLVHPNHWFNTHYSFK
jgi:hypothetical protein